MKKISVRFLAVLLAVLLLPWSILAEGYDTEPLYRSDFTARLVLNADAFSNDGSFHYSDWEKLLNKTSVQGRIGFQRLSDYIDHYARMDASLQIGEDASLPFHYESYGVSRYFTTPALGQDHLYFNTLNFWQFMLKPYYFMGLPSNLISVVLAWDMSAYTVQDFLNLAAKYFGNETELSHEELLSRCEAFSEEFSNQYLLLYYFFLQNSLGLIYGDSLVYEDLCNLRDIAEQLDPDAKGFRKETEGGTRRYIVGDTVVLTEEADGWRFSLPDTNGYEFILELRRTDDEINFSVQALTGEETRFSLAFRIDGLQRDEGLTNEGDISVDVSGGAVAENFSAESEHIQIHYRHERSSESLPRTESFSADWIHPDSGKAAIGVRYEAEISEADGSEIVNDIDRLHRGESDFFALNSDILAEMKEKYTKPLVLALVPLALEIPAGVYSDVYTMLKDSGFLAMLGFEGLE